ncbi:MAG TPA: peptidogalycan biosysnthesis protein [Gemmatimonadales bacterium]|nr:peptidogalycan biosysnthesis protein [Gemmatimonadales bacterium]
MTLLERSTGVRTGWTIAELGGAAGVPAEQWDGLARRGFHRHAWFVAAESCGLAPRHVGVQRNGVLAAIFPAYLEWASLHGDLHRRWLGPLHRLAWLAGARLRPTLAVGAPFATASDPLGEVESLPDDVLAGVLDRLEAIARAEGTRAVVWPFLADPTGQLAAAARRAGYVEAFAGSTARLPLAWRGFDGYVAARSRSVRRTVRREREAFAAAGLRLEAAPDWRHAAAAGESLYRAEARARDGREPLLPRGFLERLAAAPAPGIWAQLTWRDGELAGFSVNLEAAGVVDGTLAGFAAGPATEAAWLNDLVHAPIALGCAAGCARLELGPTALRAKLLRGATLVPRVTLARGTTRRTRALLTILAPVVDRRLRRKERRRVPGADR